MAFQEAFETWMHKQITEEENPRRRERLNRGLGPGEMALLQRAWYPAIGRVLLKNLVNRKILIVASGNLRYRTFMFPAEGWGKTARLPEYASPGTETNLIQY